MPNRLVWGDRADTALDQYDETLKLCQACIMYFFFNRMLEFDDYVDLAWTAFAEVPGSIFGMIFTIFYLRTNPPS